MEQILILTLTMWTIVLCAVSWYLIVSDKSKPKKRNVTFYYLSLPENDHLLLEVYMEKADKVEESRKKIYKEINKLKYWDELRLHSIDKVFSWFANIRCKRIVNKIERLKISYTSDLIVQNSLQKIMYEGLPSLSERNVSYSLNQRFSRF